MKKLKDIISTDFDIDVSGIVEDSRLVKDNYIFVVTHGFNVDHYDYIDDAISRGCSFLVVDGEINIDFPHVVVDNINKYYIEMCKKYYDIDTSNFYLIGITGTDGKTTSATITKEIIKDCAYIGTNGLTIKDKTYQLSNTTPCVSELYYCFSLIQEAGIKNVVMEVSSEALLHERIAGLKYDIIAFTNITEDHLNVHKNFNNYLNCKLKLLKYIKNNGKVIVNLDDVNLCKIKCKNMYTFGKDKCSNYVISDIKVNNNYSEIIINNSIYITSPLIGEYNAYNVVLAYIICTLFGIKRDTIIERINKLLPIKGRAERLDFGQDYLIVLDYAHTINGVKSILETYKKYKKIITVSGCAGGRDKSKRSIIGNLIIKNSDISIFTMDDPRYENVNTIIDEMAGDNKNYIRIVDRREAINYALSIASTNSVVLILGKGRDNYMAIQDKKIPYSDYNVIQNYFE